ncbi:hypothetical protein [Pseudomonas sp. WS 5051]|uniref:hypothetical protein n=1 Tax=Pseudomonas sp. WS 5051 TaxID=2717482 RepID=UPI00147638CD|nr:hypothetical protein [Pseudomonas sp. WS 5051]NMY56899.1 hypothetical protein [Pseudomonas sp. WS 5051]
MIAQGLARTYHLPALRLCRAVVTSEAGSGGLGVMGLAKMVAAGAVSLVGILTVDPLELSEVLANGWSERFVKLAREAGKLIRQ